MNSSFSYKYIIHWLLYVAFQVMVLNGVDYLHVATPFLFILFLINLPTELSPISFMLVSFFTGLIVDIFSSTPGIHSFACVLIAYIKPLLCKAFGPSDAMTLTPSFKTFGQIRYLQYALTMVSIHHFLFYFLENGSTRLLIPVLLKAVFSILLTMILVFAIEYLKNRHRIVER